MKCTPNDADPNQDYIFRKRDADEIDNDHLEILFNRWNESDKNPIILFETIGYCYTAGIDFPDWVMAAIGKAVVNVMDSNGESDICEELGIQTKGFIKKQLTSYDKENWCFQIWYESRTQGIGIEKAIEIVRDRADNLDIECPDFGALYEYYKKNKLSKKFDSNPTWTALIEITKNSPK